MRYALAEVRKEFFTEMFTRDISLEDCILDLIDNSIDSYLLKHGLSISQLIFGANRSTTKPRAGTIEVTCNERQIKIVDTCGGIPRKSATEDVFCFGHTDDDPKGRLGAYGVGMKRALFKIGNSFQIVSRTEKEGFEVSLKVDDWVNRPSWKVPITYIDGAESERKAGTSITITELREEVALRIEGGGVPKNIFKDASTTYPYFLDECVDLEINGTHVPPERVPLGEREGVVQSAHEKLEYDGVKATLVATIAPGRRSMEQAGWYILCNGRAVVRANKDDLTGWGTDLANFHSKYSSFIGLASFESDNPLSLPWTTTKRNINRESRGFIRARNLMATMSKPILTTLSRMYPNDPDSDATDIREAVSAVKEVQFREIASRPPSGFSYTPPKREEKKNEWVRFQASVKSLDKVRGHLGRPSMSASDIGKMTLAHYVKTECAP